MLFQLIGPSEVCALPLGIAAECSVHYFVWDPRPLPPALCYIWLDKAPSIPLLSVFPWLVCQVVGQMWAAPRTSHNWQRLPEINSYFITWCALMWKQNEDDQVLQFQCTVADCKCSTTFCMVTSFFVYETSRIFTRRVRNQSNFFSIFDIVEGLRQTTY